MWDTLAKLGFDTVIAGMKKREKKLSVEQYEKLIGEAIKELLKLHPDIDTAHASLLAAEALDVPHSAAHLRATRTVHVMRAKKAMAKPGKKPGKKRRKKAARRRKKR